MYNSFSPRVKYLLQIADNALIVGQRLGELCGHGPVLEQDIALTNIALDQIGQARLLYQLAAGFEAKGRSEDDIAYLREERQYFNVLLVEQPNTDFAFTIVRQFILDTFNFHFYTMLLESQDKGLASIAEKTLKEIKYHYRYSSEWMKRLGDGTDESHKRAQDALNHLWVYTEELVTPVDVDRVMYNEGVTGSLEEIRPKYFNTMKSLIREATLDIPQNVFQQFGGKEGIHTEQMGYILADMQYLQRTHPNTTW